MLILLTALSLAAPQIPLTKEVWNQKNPEEQAEILVDLDYDPLREFSGHTIHKFEEVTEEQALGETPAAKLAARLRTYAADLADREAIEQTVGSDTKIATVGGTEFSIYVLEGSDGELLAAYASLYQQGAHKYEELTGDEEFEFDTREDAIAAGFDPDADVAWSAGVSISAEGELLPETYGAQNVFTWSGW